MGLYSIDYYPDLTNREILEGNIKCEECTRQLWNYMKNQLLKELYHLVCSLNKIDNEPGDFIFILLPILCNKIYRWILHNY